MPLPSNRRHVWLALGSAVLLGLCLGGYYVLAWPVKFGLNYRVYDAAARAAIAGTDFYAVTPPNSRFHYLYPPVTVLAFVPLARLGDWPVGYAVLTLHTVVASGWLTLLLARYVESLGYRVPRSDRLLLGAYVLVSVHAVPSLAYGQINHLLVAAFGAGLVWLERDREWLAGVALALPAFVKVFPAAVGLWLLYRRAWRTIAAAVATASALTAAGLAAFGPGTYRTYVFDVLLARRDTQAFVGGLDPGVSYVTLRRPLSVLFPAVDPTWYAVGAAVLLAPVLAALYWRACTVTDRLVALYATLVAMLLFFPSLLLYYVFLTVPLVVLLYDLPQGWGRRLFVGGTLLATLSLSFNAVPRLLSLLPLTPETATQVAAALRPVFALGTPVLYGCLLSLIGCLVYRVERDPVPDARETAAPETSD
ncbi:glycosyltransferase family 87 protein [Halomicroarcula sp. GCM10025709]|uniref:glycosyltransferase family 87 protein n=1 Tax=Haloarcula TaxID=2237 RepID=UPI0024C3977A|nr:glycosyltransferase family 87 protein [Halomicroarcula sp. YJ-61-S]